MKVIKFNLDGIWIGTLIEKKKRRTELKSTILESDDLRSAWSGLETYLDRNFAYILRLNSIAKWRDEPITPEQLKLLESYKIEITPNITKGIASDMITRFMFGSKSAAKKSTRLLAKQRKLEKKFQLYE